MHPKIKKITFYALCISIISLVVLLWYFSIFGQISQGLGGGVDFLAYYAGGYILHFENPHEVYNLSSQQIVQNAVLDRYQVTGPLYPYNHPPIYIPLLSLITSQGYNLTYMRWVGLLVLFHLITLSALMHYLVAKLQYQPEKLVCFALAALFFLPIHIAYTKGQDSPLLLLGTTLWMLGMLLKKESLATFGLTLSMVRPQIALALLIPTIVYHIKWTRWLLVWGTIFFAINFPWIGWQGVRDFLNILRISGQGYGFDVDLMATFMGAILRTFPNISPLIFHIIGYTAYFLAIGLISLWWKQQSSIELEHIGLALLIILFFSPHTHNHDHSLFLLPAFALAISLVRQKRIPISESSTIIAGTSLLLSIHVFTGNTLFVYLAMIAIGMSLWKSLKSSTLTTQPAF